MTLSKAICRECVGKRASFESNWELGLAVECPFRVAEPEAAGEYSESMVKLVRRAAATARLREASLGGSPPFWCPFVLEHAVND